MEVEDSNNTTMTKEVSMQRKTRYRELLDKVDTLNESGDLGIETAKQLHSVFLEANQLDAEVPIKERVHEIEETLMDSLVLSSASNILVKCCEAFDITETEYSSQDFAEKLKEKIDNEGWKELLDSARRIIKDVTQCSTTFGGLHQDNMPKPKEKKERKMKQAAEQVEKRKPEMVVNKENEEDGIDEIVGFLNTVLKEEYEKNGSEPIDYYRFVVDKENFSNTVENMFYCSFLIRNGEAMMDIDTNGNPIIKPISSKKLKRFRDSNGRNTQMIASISMDDWEKIGITEGFLENRRKQKLN